jgi:TPR repeat protein
MSTKMQAVGDNLDSAPPLETSEADADTVDSLVWALGAAARGDKPAAWLSMALADLAGRGGTLSGEQRDDIIRALIRFTHRADVVLPADIPRDAIQTGLQAAFLQAVHWSKPIEERFGDDAQDDYDDMEDHARILRNHAHNSALASDIKKRQARRARKTGRGKLS